MFRKIINIIIVFLLLISTSGFTISRHYCGDNLVSVVINSEAKSCCDMHGCCHDESEFFKVNNDFSNNIQTFNIEVFTSIFLFIKSYSFQNKIQEYFPFIFKKPPGFTSLKITNLICCFLF